MPHCPRCLEEPPGALARCPWDRSFYVVTRCPGCQAEVFPRERFCAACAHGFQVRAAAQAPLQRASPLRRWLSFLVDLLAIFVFSPLMLEVWDHPGAPILFTALYFVALQTGGRQTLGQLVLRCVVLDQHWRSLSWKGAIGRVLTLGWGRGSALWSSPEL